MTVGRDSTRQPTTQAVTTTPGRSRRDSPASGLTPLAASALVPVTLAVMAGSPVAIALTAVSGTAGSRYLTGAIDRAASRLRRGGPKPPAPETVRDTLAGELGALLAGDQLLARVLVPELTEILRHTGVLDTDGPSESDSPAT
jgi:hypothetical protein